MKKNNWRTRRKTLIEQLGAKCARCSKTSDLAIDHKKPANWTPNRISKEKRLRRYLAAARAGRLQILCNDCHNAKSAREGAGYDPLERYIKETTAEFLPDPW